MPARANRASAPMAWRFRAAYGMLGLTIRGRRPDIARTITIRMFSVRVTFERLLALKADVE